MLTKKTVADIKNACTNVENEFEFQEKMAQNHKDAKKIMMGNTCQKTNCSRIQDDDHSHGYRDTTI